MKKEHFPDFYVSSRQQSELQYNPEQVGKGRKSPWFAHSGYSEELDPSKIAFIFMCSTHRETGFSSLHWSELNN